MDHLAIMDKRTRFIDKILSRKKVIESRWYKTRRPPWGKIHKGDIIFFKYSGEQVIAKARVSRVVQLDNLSNKDIQQVIDKYCKRLGIPKDILPRFVRMHRDKKYGILIFLEGSQKIKPFQINKKGYGSMSAWICVDSIKKIAI